MWAYVMSLCPAMGNPYEFRETMLSAFGWSEKTREQLASERRDRERLANKPTPKGRRRTPSKIAPAGEVKPRQSEVDKLNALLANAKPRQRPVSE